MHRFILSSPQSEPSDSDEENSAVALKSYLQSTQNEHEHFAPQPPSQPLPSSPSDIFGVDNAQLRSALEEVRRSIEHDTDFLLQRIYSHRHEGLSVMADRLWEALRDEPSPIDVATRRLNDEMRELWHNLTDCGPLCDHANDAELKQLFVGLVDQLERAFVMAWSVVGHLHSRKMLQVAMSPERLRADVVQKAANGAQMVAPLLVRLGKMAEKKANNAVLVVEAFLRHMRMNEYYLRGDQIYRPVTLPQPDGTALRTFSFQRVCSIDEFIMQNANIHTLCGQIIHSNSTQKKKSIKDSLTLFVHSELPRLEINFNMRTFRNGVYLLKTETEIELDEDDDTEELPAGRTVKQFSDKFLTFDQANEQLPWNWCSSATFDVDFNVQWLMGDWRQIGVPSINNDIPDVVEMVMEAQEWDRETRDFLWFMMGRLMHCCLRTDSMHLILEFYGEGGVGKSSLVGAIKRAMLSSDLLGLQAESELFKVMGAGNSQQFGLTNAEKAVLVSIEEVMEYTKLDVGALKALSGMDPVEINRKYQDPQTFYIYAGIVISGNRRIQISKFDDRGGWDRRVCPAHFQKLNNASAAKLSETDVRSQLVHSAGAFCVKANQAYLNRFNALLRLGVDKIDSKIAIRKGLGVPEAIVRMRKQLDVVNVHRALKLMLEDAAWVHYPIEEAEHRTVGPSGRRLREDYFISLDDLTNMLRAFCAKYKYNIRDQLHKSNWKDLFMDNGITVYPEGAGSLGRTIRYRRGVKPSEAQCTDETAPRSRYFGTTVPTREIEYIEFAAMSPQLVTMQWNDASAAAAGTHNNAQW